MHRYATSSVIGQGSLQQCLSTYIPCVLSQMIQFARLSLKRPDLLFCVPLISEELDFEVGKVSCSILVELFDFCIFLSGSDFLYCIPPH